MCLLFVMVDLGRPDRFCTCSRCCGHLNFLGRFWRGRAGFEHLFRAQTSLWRRTFCIAPLTGVPTSRGLVVPLVLLSVPMAVGIHTVTAFLYNATRGEPYWNSSILARSSSRRRSAPAQRFCSSYSSYCGGSRGLRSRRGNLEDRGTDGVRHVSESLPARGGGRSRSSTQIQSTCCIRATGIRSWRTPDAGSVCSMVGGGAERDCLWCAFISPAAPPAMDYAERWLSLGDFTPESTSRRVWG